jgi:hypothetical protein
MELDKCAQQVSFGAKRSLAEHALALHGAVFTGEDAHQIDHRFSAAVKGNMELEEGAAYKISNLILFDHIHDAKGYAVVRYYPARCPRRHQENGHEQLP